jgi:hypothetical protein
MTYHITSHDVAQHHRTCRPYLVRVGMPRVRSSQAHIRERLVVLSVSVIWCSLVRVWKGRWVGTEATNTMVSLHLINFNGSLFIQACLLFPQCVMQMSTYFSDRCMLVPIYSNVTAGTTCDKRDIYLYHNLILIPSCLPSPTSITQQKFQNSQFYKILKLRLAACLSRGCLGFPR